MTQAACFSMEDDDYGNFNTGLGKFDAATREAE
jgi:hypothetical protein